MLTLKILMKMENHYSTFENLMPEFTEKGEKKNIVEIE
jgi:hypothetical protein